MITVNPFGGLGNRIRVQHSMLSLQPASMSDIKVLWEHSRNFNCSIYELFIIPDEITVEEWPLTLPYNLRRKILKRIFQTPLLKFKYDLMLDKQDIIRLRNEKYDFKKLLNYSSVYIKTCQWFYTGSERFKYFEPNPEISEKADLIARNFNEYMLGVHIRRTDHSLSIKASPLSEFIKIMQWEIDRNKNTMFFCQMILKR